MLVKGVQGGSKLREEVVCGGAGSVLCVRMLGVQAGGKLWDFKECASKGSSCRVST